MKMTISGSTCILGLPILSVRSNDFILSSIEVMKKTSSTILFVALSLFMLTGCSSSKKMAKVHPLVGTWEYNVEAPDGSYPGMITIMEMDGKLVGKISSDALAGSMDLSNLMFEDNTVSFNFESGQFGMIAAKALLEGDALNGTINVSGVGDLPITGMRKKDM